jgi:hypothetical protein
MYQTSLYYHLKATKDKKDILNMFFKDWADRICNEEVAYSTVAGDGGGRHWWNEIIKVDFANSEDALVMQLKGVPEELQHYLTPINYSEYS